MSARVGRQFADITDSRARIAVAAALVGFAFAAVEYGVHMAVAHSGVREAWKPAADAAVIWAAATGFAFLWLFTHRERRRQVRQELEKVAELNHRVRNALEVIVGAHYNPPGEQERAIRDAVGRIDVTLRDLFPPPHEAHHRSGRPR